MENEKDFYTVLEFADKLRVHPNTIRKGLHNGRIQGFRVGEGSRSSYRIPATEAQRLAELNLSLVIEKLIDEKLGERK